MAQFDNVEFRTFDYEGFKDSLFQLAKNEFTNWTDTLESNSGVMFIEWLAFVAGNVTFMQNFHARQGFVVTATEAQSMTWLAKQYDYDIPNNVAASTDVEISNANGVPFTVDVIIPAGTQLLTTGAEQLIFETIADLTIPQGNISGTIGARNEETKIENDVSDGSSNFETELTFGPFIEASMIVAVDDVVWTQVDNFLDSISTSEHYLVEVDSDQVPKVVFGDGINGKAPPLNSDLVYSYKVGGGSDGNVPPGSITEIPGTFFDVNNNPVDLTVTNTIAASGGGDREDIEITRLRLPASIAAKDITLNYEDFEVNIGNVPGVARVSVKTVNDDPNIPENTVLAFVLPEVGDTLTEALETQIRAEVGPESENPTPLTQELILVGPSLVTIPIVITDLVPEPGDDDGTGVKANATITVIDNNFDANDAVIVNGVTFEETTDWLVGVDEDESAANIAQAINQSVNPLLQDIEASAVGAVVTVNARTTGPEGDAYTLAEIDGATDNFTLSGSNFENGEDSTIQAEIRAGFDAFFGRTNIDEDGEFTVGFAQTVYRNKLIWVVHEVESVLSFDLTTPAADTELQLNEFPTYTLQFLTS